MNNLFVTDQQSGNLNYIESEETEESCEALSVEEQLELLGARVVEIAKLTKNESKSVENTIQIGKRQLLAAQESFRLGVIGEFRVGKSTLINALLGQEVAFTDIMEATATECLFHFGEERQATIHYKDNSTEIVTVEGMNDILDRNREEKAWLDKIDHIAYSVNSERLKEFDLWDAPGIGGGDDNERLADRFLEKLGGAVWVLDATLIGKSSITRPLLHLKKTGKPVIGVLNRIDEYDGNLGDAVEFLHKSYPDLFSDVILMSAIDEFETVLDGNTSDALEKLWSVVLNTFGRDQDGGLKTRLDMTISTVNSDLAEHVSMLKRSVRDQIGLCEHISFNLENEKQRLLVDFPSVFEIHTNKVFSELEADFWRSLDLNNSSSNDRDIRIEELIDELQQQTTYEIALNVIKDRVTEDISVAWYKATREAISLSRTAMSVVGSAQCGTNKIYPAPHLTNSEKDGLDDFSEEAMDEAIYAGGMSAIFAGALAAASASISWPVILVALPVGALAAWKKQKVMDRSPNDLSAHINNVLNTAKSKFLDQYSLIIQEQLDNALDDEIEGIVSRRIPIEVGVDNLGVLEECVLQLERLEKELGMETPDCQFPLSQNILFKKMSQPGTRLDVVITDPEISLASVLAQMTPDSSVRLILVTERSIGETDSFIENVFGNWQGKKKFRAMNFRVPLLRGDLNAMLISSEFAVETKFSIEEVPQQNLSFSDIQGGRLAAQRTFAKLWDGKPVGM